MKLLFPVSFFLIWTTFIAALSGSIGGFINIPSAAFLAPAVLCLAVASTSKQALIDSYHLAIHERTFTDKQRIQQARTFLNVAAKQSLLIGALGVLIGWCAIAQWVDNWSNIGPAFGISLLTLVYGVILKAICDTAEKRIESQYCSSLKIQ